MLAPPLFMPSWRFSKSRGGGPKQLSRLWEAGDVFRFVSLVHLWACERHKLVAMAVAAVVRFSIANMKQRQEQEEDG